MRTRDLGGDGYGLCKDMVCRSPVGGRGEHQEKTSGNGRETSNALEAGSLRLQQRQSRGSGPRVPAENRMDEGPGGGGTDRAPNVPETRQQGWERA